MRDEDTPQAMLVERIERVRASQSRFRTALSSLPELVRRQEDRIQPLLLARLELSRSIRARRREILAFQAVVSTYYPHLCCSFCGTPRLATLEDKTTPHFSAWTAMRTALDRLAYAEVLSELVPDLVAASELEISSLMVSGTACLLTE